jgi:ABC-2 type transport system permease protein
MNSTTSLIPYLTLARKEITRYLRIWQQTFFPPIITTSLYFVIFGNLIGNRIGEMDGYAYIDFIVPGLILMSIITNSYANVASSFFGAKFQSFIEEIMVSPTSHNIILLGYVTGGVSRGLLIGILVCLVSQLFTDISIHNGLVVISIALLTSVLFSLAGLLNGLFAKSFDDVSIVPTFVLTPLTYLGGIFYSINLLPEIWQTISLVNPILYMINAFRYGFLGISDINLILSYVIVIGFIIALGSWANYLLKNGYGIRN